MEDPRAEKVAVVTEVKERLGRADAALLTEYRGLNVAAMAELRRALRAAGGDYKIYKNTLARLGARSAGIDTLDDLLVGPTAIAFVDGDAAAVAKALRDYATDQPRARREGRVARPARAHRERGHGARRPAEPRGDPRPARRCAAGADRSSSPACSRRCPATSPTA